MKTLLFALLTLMATPDSARLMYHIRIESDIDRQSRRYLEKGLEKAAEAKADFIILDLDTYGGAVDAADKMRTSLLRSEIPVAAYVNPQAASAGALISIACDSIYMRTGSSIGAATVVDQTGRVMPDKYQSFMRGMMRSTAEARGRDPLVAEAMVDTAHVLSLTPAEAIEKGYCDGVAESVEEVAEALSGGDPYVIEDMKLTAVEKVAHFMMNPLLQAIFLIMILGGIYIEFKTPGIGLPLVIAIVGAVLYFSPLYIESVARYWEILLFLAGLVLLGLELFVIPGFGVCGISGIVCILVSLVFAAVDNAELLRFDGTLDLKPVVVPVSIVVCSACAAVAGGLFLVRKLYPTKAFDSVALRESLAPEDGCVGVRTGLESLVGEEVEVVTDLKPAGKVKTASGKVVEATLDHGYAARGTVVKVEKAEQGRLYVRR
ncbi:MAG: nodulation protein NfeD [Bacteroidales bacterium]|nr:nodulation protein NfeD [Bacteroidales bacterium]